MRKPRPDPPSASEVSPRTHITENTASDMGSLLKSWGHHVLISEGTESPAQQVISESAQAKSPLKYDLRDDWKCKAALVKLCQCESTWRVGQAPVSVSLT